jgi:tetratricopeptide (TPR) repeat protein
MVELLARYPDNAAFLSAFVQMLLEHDAEISDIQPRLNKLVELRPDEPSTLGLRARVLVKSGKPEEAVSLLKSLIPDPLPNDQVGRLRDVAKLMEELDQNKPAEELLTAFAEKARGGALELAAFLGRRGRLDEALDQCEAAIADLPASAALPIAVGALRDNVKRLTPDHIRRLNKWFDEALQAEPKSKAVALQLAALRDLEGKHDEAIAIYRDFLDRDDLTDRQKAIGWNNLAFMLAAGGENGAESLEMVNKAIDILGPSAELLDTRAVAYLATGQYQLALSDAKRAVDDSPSGVKYFHLALAHVAAKDSSAAASALRTGRNEHGLTPEQIPGIERGKYEKLIRSLDVL